MKHFKTHAFLKNHRPREDKSETITFETPELDDSQALELRHMHGLNVWLEFKPLDVEPDGEIVIDKKVNKMTRSQELRFWIKLLWEAEKKFEDFDLYYDNHMKKIIDFVRQKKQKIESPI